jgi:hypothetical protein
LQIELNKLFGLYGYLTFEELCFIQEIEINAQFSIRLPTGVDVLYSLVYLPITRQGTPPGDAYVIDGKWPLGATHNYPGIPNKVPSLCMKMSPVGLNIDWGALKTMEHSVAQSSVEMKIERLMPDVFEALTRFYEAYRHAKYEVDSEIGRDLTQAIDATRRMPDWEFRSGLCYQITDGPNVFAGWFTGGKVRGWNDASTQKLRTLIQQHMVEGVDFIKSRLFDAEESLYDGDLPMAVVSAVLALEAALSDFVRAGWRARGVTKSRIDEAKKDISLSAMLNIELIALAPETNKPRAELIGALNHARKVRNDIIHEKKHDVSYQEARESVESVKELVGYLESLPGTAV